MRRALLLVLLTACSSPSESKKHKPERPHPRPRTLASSGNVTCAIENGRMFCWGGPSRVPGPGGPPWHDGRISSRTPPLPPYEVFLPSAPVAVALDNALGCVLLEDGEVRCYGSNLGETDRCWHHWSHVFVPIALPGPADRIAVTGDAACARLRDGRVVCWGRIDGERDWDRGCDPRVVRDASGDAFTGAERLEVGAAIDAKGRIALWDHAADEPVARFAFDIGRVVDVAVTDDSVHAVGRDGEIHALVGGRIGLIDVERLRCPGYGFCAAVIGDGFVYEIGLNLVFEEPPPPPRPIYRPRFRAHPIELEVGRGGGCMRDADGIACWDWARVPPVETEDGPAAPITLPSP